VLRENCEYIGSSVVTGETDWKVIAIDVTDPLANDLDGTLV